MKTIDIYEIGEEVLIKAKVSDIIVENGEVKYRLKTEHSNNDLDHKYTDHQMIPYSKENWITDGEEEEEEDEPKDYIEEAERNWKKNREERRQILS